jgi:hypothetical protein
MSKDVRLSDGDDEFVDTPADDGEEETEDGVVDVPDDGEELDDTDL